MLDYDVEGPRNAPAMVLLHSLALDRSVWERIRPRLASRFRRFALDLPGHGGSPPPPEPTITAIAGEVDAFLAEEGIERAVVVGMSLGGCVAQALAARHPGRVAGLGLIDTTCWYGPTAVQDWEERVRTVEEEGFGALAEFQLQRWFTPAFREQHPDVGERLLEVFRANDLAGYAASCRAMGAMDLRHDVEGIAVPTTIIVGEDDRATPLPHAEELHRRIAGSELHVLSGSSHLSAVERPDAVAEALEADLFERVRL